MILKIKDMYFTFETYREPLKDQDIVEGSDVVEPNNCGFTMRSKGKVFINKEIAQDQLLITIIHEMTHCYIWAYGFNQIKWEEENVCDFVSIYCDRILRDSKKVYKELFKK